MQDIVKVAVGSMNPVKLNSAKCGLAKAMRKPAEAIEIKGYNVSSDVSDQPFGDEETRTGAVNRAMKAWSKYKDEHGIEPTYSIGE